ncbi:hypothetical protein B0293_09875 [Amycolatopsis azurea DSM 43854]|uniref:Secreted protein n=1 Tax=Amycolatopsis azurea DSM 43854 TaxID=1238180 RepID=A0ABX3JGB2_9PSEU|nr:hypothetical protein B0293_09875 [Amycolatopsis azurea DSM 43854]
MLMLWSPSLSCLRPGDGAGSPFSTSSPRSDDETRGIGGLGCCESHFRNLQRCGSGFRNLPGLRRPRDSRNTGP